MSEIAEFADGNMMFTYSETDDIGFDQAQAIYIACFEAHQKELLLLRFGPE